MKKIIIPIIASIIALTSCNTLADDVRVQPSDWSEGKVPQPCYLMTYIGSKQLITSDTLHMAVSEDGYTWTSLNSGNTIFSTNSGSKHFRDPSIFRLNDGTFVLLAADFTSSGHYKDLGSRSDVNNYWEHPSNKIYVAFSADLVNWTEGHFLQVTDGKGKNGNTRHVWTPKARYNKINKCYDIYWVGDDEEGINHVYRTQTYDFFNAKYESSIKIYDPGYSVIDAAVVDAGSEFLMFTKDSNTVFGTSTGGDIQVSSSSEWDTPGFKRVSKDYINRLDKQETMIQVEYPCVYRAGDNRWVLLANETNTLTNFNAFVCSGDMKKVSNWKSASDASATFSLPSSATDVSVTKITRSEYDNLVLLF